jgi:ATP-binding cassette subfamily B (MDR/TAP) protein 1
MNVTNITIQFLANTIADLGNLQKAFTAFRSIYSTLETKSLIPPFKNDNLSKISATNINGKIEFRNVFFAYPTRPDNIILKDVSLTIMPGQNIGIVGTSGSGKSTIIQLINRFYDVEEGKGEILIDDINIKDYNLYELRKKIGLVSQEPSLFRVPHLENVRYGRLDAKDEECFQAIRDADIMAIFTKNKENEENKININNVPFGNDPENDNIISGGEKQRLCIARVFIKKPTILLLDEATSALDKEAESEIQKSLDKLAKNRTSISVAHKINTVENCDQIFVMENGRIIEKGTHQELLSLKRVYYTLYRYSSMN